jgi:hypothetical protein
MTAIYRRLEKVEKKLLPKSPEWRHWLEMNDGQLAWVIGQAYGLTPDEVLALPDDDLLSMVERKT